VHSIMSEAGEKYIQDFGKVFEKHVISEARTLAQEVYSESDIQRWTGDDEEVVDALVAHRGRNVLIEAKAGLFAEVVMAVGHSEIFLHKTRALPKAVSQAWATSLGVRQSRLAPEPVSRAEGNYLLIVTNRELSTGEGTSLASMYPEGTMNPENPDALALLPLENIFVVSISDFERLAHAVRNEHLDLVEFLDLCVAANKDGQTSRLYIGHHLDREKIPRNGRSKLVNDAIDVCSNRLASVLEKQSPKP
jgi:hypothetical protein